MSDSIAGIPEEARELFDRLLREPLCDPGELRGEVIAYTSAFDPLASREIASDPILAMSISSVCVALLEEMSDKTPELERRLVQAACRYFIIEQDAVPDQREGGLEDDMQVVNAVARHLGREDLVITRAPQDGAGTG